MVKDPPTYLRAELAALSRVVDFASARCEQLKGLHSTAKLPQASIDRHNDVAEAEIAQAKILFSLLAADHGSLTAPGGQPVQTYHPGWTVEALLPYLIRDWTSSTELSAAKSLIGEALQLFFEGSSGKSLAVAGCGAGGLMTGLPPSFEKITGFDLTLPILGAARHLLDGNSLDLPIPRTIQKDGRITLCCPGLTSCDTRVAMAAMNALDTAFADGSLDCVITSFLIDLIPDPTKLAEEIYRILAVGGVWVNYGPSGPLKATWRFDNAETNGFFETFGFAPIYARTHRTTYLDLSGEFPSWSSRIHTCYLSAARKTNRSPIVQKAPTLLPTELLQAIPRHYPSASLISRQRLGPERKRTTMLRFERLPGKMESAALGEKEVSILEQVDGRRTVQEIAELLSPGLSKEETVRAFTHSFEARLLLWDSG